LGFFDGFYKITTDIGAFFTNLWGIKFTNFIIFLIMLALTIFAIWIYFKKVKKK